MPLNECITNIRKFLYTSHKNSGKSMFRVTVIKFEDRCNCDCGLFLAELLKRSSLFELNYFNEAFPKGFLNLQGRNFFDFIDRGTQILQKTQSDILIWGYEENGKIRLNFQVADQYTIPNDISFSLLDSLFIPLDYFTKEKKFSESLLLLIYGIIVAAINSGNHEQTKNKTKILKEIIALLSADSSPKDISLEFIPYIMNMLGKVYLNSVKEKISVEDINIIKTLFETALKNKEFIRLPIHYGCIYNNLGQLYEIALDSDSVHAFTVIKQAIAYYRDAQKYLNRNYPYDYGLISYHLALLYFEFWKNTADLQALRDAVSQLREAKKVYTFSQFPQSWSYIQGLLGYYLTSLGMNTSSRDIMHLAIACYKKKQEVFKQYTHPEEWAKIQEEIGNIYYLLGKQDQDDKLMREARNYFISALNVYNEMKMKEQAEPVQNCLAKIDNYID